ncbi:hypothetical protein [Alloactinosynnema sp. L-07]|uniref:hypothetical protein n=1 Tax=Alloactinosynnema sp. L-07 TaxID=1653480 RepID=UPI00065EF126|nr:hypothetical protein [Alloactinosynnema sp. L-07]CRK57387.1 hypothetical protein [Alloactinosynnema sp. L-07]
MTITQSKAAIAPTTLLRRLLALDAVVTGGNGLIYLFASVWVADLLGVSAGALVGIGAFLVVYGIAVGALALSKSPARGLAMAVVEANLVWALASVVIAVFGLMGANTIGTVWTIVQAVAVAGFGATQQYALNKIKAAA